MESLKEASRRFLAWFRDEALPLWAARAWDAQKGGFHEALGFDGAPAPGPVRRVRVQARQIYAFMEAARAGWLPTGAELARLGFDYFLDKACPDGGARGCVHLISPEGAVIDARRDLYDQAFLLLACASLWRAGRDQRALGLANRTLAFLDGEFAAPAGGYREDDQGTRPRRQNPHMHLFEALLALHGATGEEAHLKRADAIYALFCERFFDREKGRLIEFFADDWRPAEGEAGRIVEPGHMAEWIWLLDLYSERRGTDVRAVRKRLFEGARRLGADPASGFLVDRMIPGSPAPDRGRRLWPQTEYLRACLVLARHGDGEAAETGAALVGALFATYLDQKVAGLWCDRYDSAGRPAAKDVPASILYHLETAALEAQRFLGNKPA